MTGIVSRADLLRVAATGAFGTAFQAAKPEHRGFLSDLFGEYHWPAWEVLSARGTEPPPPEAIDIAATASAFRALEGDFRSTEAQQRDAAHAAGEKYSQETAQRLIDTHVSDDTWRKLLQDARKVAGKGATEWLVLRFPNQLCSDGGRAINIADAGWPATLRGEAAELYLRRVLELQPAGFGLSAHVLDFPGGMPGDIGMFLVWGE